MLSKKLKPWSFMLLLLLTAFITGCGCSIETVEDHNAKLEAEALERSAALEELLNQTEADSSTSPVSSSEINTAPTETETTANITETTDTTGFGLQTKGQAGLQANDNNTSALENTKPVSSSDTTTDNSANTQSAAVKHETQSSQTTEASQGNAEKQETETTAPYIMVHITITCSKVVDSPKLSTSAPLPENGIMLDTYVAVKNGDSVFTALKAAADDNGLTLTYTGTKNNVYVAGINGLNEKQCGRYSGWKYSVNNVYPNVGCGGYTLSDGDSILFGYVADYNDTY